MIDYRECAKLADSVYDEAPGRIYGWSVLKAFGSSRYKTHWGANSTHKLRIDSGFFGAIYKRKNSEVYAIVFRGTELLDPGDIDADFQIGASLVLSRSKFNHRQLDDARKVIKYFLESHATTGSKAVVTGHSLGGALAQLAGYEFGHPIVAFNAPGVAKLLAKMTSKEAAPNNIVNIRARLDPISAFGKIAGKKVEIDLPKVRIHSRKEGYSYLAAQNSLEQHSMKNMLKYLSSHPIGRTTIQFSSD